MTFPISNFQSPISRNAGKPAGWRRGQIGDWQLAIENAFSLVEILVVVSLLSLIVLALMAVFSTTQRAFRAAATQSDVLEGSRAAVELMTADLRGTAPSYGAYYSGAVNFLVTNNANYSQPLVQSLPPNTGQNRSNLLQQVFILQHENNRWWGVAYAVSLNSSGNLYSLYRLQYPPPGINVTDPSTLFTNQVFQNFYFNPTNGGSRLIDGVVHFVVRAYDPNGIWIPNGFAVGQTNSLKQTWFFPFSLVGGEAGFAMYSNNVPAAVELDLGVMEDRTLARAESLSQNLTAQGNYLSQQSGAVHVFRQRVSIPNVDPSAYP
jgi:type II secretory pathway pseudopilin PulG